MPRSFVVPSLPVLGLLAILGTFACGTGSLRAQLTTSRPVTPSSQSRYPGDEDPFRDDPGLRKRLEKSRTAERQRRIVDDADRLVDLTAQYQKALQAHGAPTQDDQKLLAQIEKLARDVKDRMRGM